MFTAGRKIHKDKGLEPSEFEYNVAQVCPFFNDWFVYVSVHLFTCLNVLNTWLLAVHL